MIGGAAAPAREDRDSPDRVRPFARPGRHRLPGPGGCRPTSRSARSSNRRLRGKRSRALLSQPWWLPTLWEAQPQDGASSRSRTGRQIGGRTSLHARRGPGAVPDVPDQLCGVRRIPRALPGRDDPASNLRDEQLDRSELRVSRIRPATSRTLLNVADTRVAARRRNVLCASGLWSWREARQPTNPASCVR